MLLNKNRKLRKSQIKFYLLIKQSKNKNKLFIKNINKYLFQIDWTLSFELIGFKKKQKNKYLFFKFILFILLGYLALSIFKNYLFLSIFTTLNFNPNEVAHIVSLILRCININDDFTSIKTDESLKITITSNLISDMIKNL